MITSFCYTCIDFYNKHEWLRWILFLPLLIAVQWIILLIFSFINRDIINSFFFQVAVLPIAVSVSGVLLIRALAPRWPALFGWLYAGVYLLSLISYGISVYMGWEVIPPQQAVELCVGTAGAFTTQIVRQKKSKT